MNRVFKCGDRVRLLKDCLWVTREGVKCRLVSGAQGIAGEMYTETGFNFVHFDRVVGEPCLLVEQIDLELIPQGEPLTLHYVQQSEGGK